MDYYGWAEKVEVPKEEQFTIRTMRTDEIPFFLKWSQDFGWLYPEADFKAFLEINPSGLFVGDLNGTPISSFFVLNSEEYSYGTLIYVAEEHRGKKYSHILIEKVADYGNECNITSGWCDLVDADVASRERFGFVKAGRLPTYCKEAKEGMMHPDVIDLRKISNDLIKEYDLEVFGYPRKNYIAAMLEVPSTHGLAVMKDDKIVGMGVLKKTPQENSYILGPFYANDVETAKKLLDNFESLVPGSDINVQSFEEENSTKLFKDWPIVLTVNRMQIGDPAKTDTSRVYGMFA